ncbi:peptide ABC transporter substrate-binding protein [Horticoccus sp. 23ND18S-11]|uniref:peptide ABC transporter substrate-binding protein n=1 Tax=Horticoccus sp. 23ND18S-11 TaxID=3391832 RepID=UPI0039C99C95
MNSFPLRLALIIAATALLPACSRRDSAGPGRAPAQAINVSLLGDPATLDPHLFTMMLEWQVLCPLFEGLTHLAGDGITIQPGVAERWDISPDGLIYTFHLRHDAKWSNSDPLTADDFKFSMERMLNPALGFTSSSTVEPIVGALDFLEGRSKDFSTVGIRVIDAHTLEYRLRTRSPFFLTTVSTATPLGMPVHRGAVEKQGGLTDRQNRWARPGSLVGNGPFVLKEWKANQHVTMIPNAHYWAASRVRLPEIRFQVVEDLAAEERMYRTGQLHLTWTIPPTKIAGYRQNQAAEFQRSPILHTHMIALNCGRRPFDDVRVRRALALALDTRSATDAAFSGRSLPARSFIRPGTGGFDPPPWPASDPAAARRLLAEAGYPDGRGFPAVELRVNSAGSDYAALAEVMQQMWKKNLGIEITIARMEFKTIVASLEAHQFDAAIVGYYYSVDDPSEPLVAKASKGNIGNFAGWSDARFEQALEELRTAKSDTERFHHFATMESALADSMPYIPLFHNDRVYLMRPSVKGVTPNSLLITDWREVRLE